MDGLITMGGMRNRHGHGAGDALLNEIAVLVQKNIRVSDIPVRYSGDEFTIVLPNLTLTDGRARAEQLLQEARGLRFVYNSADLEACTISIGLAAYPDHGTTGSALLHAGG